MRMDYLQKQSIQVYRLEGTNSLIRTPFQDCRCKHRVGIAIDVCVFALITSRIACMIKMVEVWIV